MLSALSEWLTIFLAFVFSLAISFLMTPPVKNFAERVGAIDVPKDERRIHNHPIPRMGGLAIFIGFMCSLLIFVPMTKEVSGLLIGALIMTHSDDNGLVLPPKLAPIQVVVIPISKGGEQLQAITDKLMPMINKLRDLGISVKYDDADNKRPGFKFADYELKGVPVRLVMGGRDLEENSIEVMRRDTLEKATLPFDGIVEHVQQLLGDIQANIYAKAKKFRDEHVYVCDDYEEFKERIKDGGFFLCHWDGTPETEARIKEETQATIRCVPFAYEQTPGVDMVTGKPSKCRVLIARSY